MIKHLAHVALVVADYDEAIRYYTEILDFILLEDTRLSETKRWVRVAPSAACDCSLLLAQAANVVQVSRVGNQTGGRVFFFLLYIGGYFFSIFYFSQLFHRVFLL